MMLSCLSSLSKLGLRPSTALPGVSSLFLTTPSRLFHVTQQNDAARKGTREKARKKKVKVEVKKIGFIPHNQRGKDKWV